jgi:predicted DNA repair protein MutK
MAASSLLALIDDISTILDDVAVLTKVATKKTAGVLGDDLALNAQQVTGLKADRELPVVWAVAKGSLRNKVILVPAALLISAFAPWAVTPLLMVGGAFLCFEGFEKIAHKWLHDAREDSVRHERHIDALTRPDVDLIAFEKEKIKGAVRTDFVLSAEIIAITLGAVAEAAFGTQVVVLSGIALIMTVGVYGLVAGIVKLDDAGLYLSGKPGAFRRGVGNGILRAAPYLMKTLSIAGTAAMFMVGGGILTHGIPAAHAFIEELAHRAGDIIGMAGTLAPTVLNALAGIIAGAIVAAVVTVVKRMFRRAAPHAQTPGVRQG